jgi:hypothetical protein
MQIHTAFANTSLDDASSFAFAEAADGFTALDFSAFLSAFLSDFAMGDS